MPDIEQNAFAIRSPLTIPEAKFLDIFRGQKLCTCFIASKLPGQAVIKSVQLHR